MTIRALIIRRIADYISRHGLTRSGFCDLAGINRGWLTVLEAGGGASLASIEKVEAFLNADKAPSDNLGALCDKGGSVGFVGVCHHAQTLGPEYGPITVKYSASFPLTGAALSESNFGVNP